MKRIFIYFALIMLLVSMGLAQQGPFGKNKVQYKDFTWYFIRTDHFDIYFTDGGYELAEYTAKVAEDAYVKISKLLRYEIINRIPIIIYNSHNDFQQTNVVAEYLEEGIGGVTELFKNRVVVPFEGSYRQFRHVIHHELVHAVMNDMFYGGSLQSALINNIQIQLPMWLVEGLPEFSALRWDVNSDMFMRDATVNDYLPPIEYLDGYFAYRGGQSVFWYISRKYGDEKIGELINRIRGLRSVEAGIRSSLGMSLKELSDRWIREQKKLYWADFAKRESPDEFAKRLTDHTKRDNFYNTSPAISPTGDKIAFISDRDDYFDVFIMSAIDGRIIKKVVKGNRTKNFEELHLLTPGLTWSPDGSKIALAVKSGDSDAIFIIDVKTEKHQKITFDLDGIFSVDWSRDGSKLAFVGLKHGQSDIYVYDLSNKTLVNLTDDIFSDADPVWSSDGKFVYFSSDRKDFVSKDMIPQDFKMYNFDPNQYDIYSVSLETKEIKRITHTDYWDETSPVVSPDGKKILFISDRNGINNIYEKDLETGNERPLTNSLSGIYQLSITYDGSKLAFASFHNGGFDIFLLRQPFERKLNVQELEPTVFVMEFLKEKQRELAKAEKSEKEETSNASDTTSIQPYGSDIKVNLRNYIFADIFRQDSIAMSIRSRVDLTPPDNLDESGRYKVYRYRVNFTPDLIYTNASYNTFYGVLGEAFMMFSDMLGNHQIYLITSLMFDLKNSDYAIAYFYLPKRINWGIEAFHIARFFSVGSQYYYLYRYRLYGGTVMGSYPIDKFRRIDFGIGYYSVVGEYLDFPEIGEHSTLLMPSLTYVHDNSLWRYIFPSNGERYYFSIYASPKLGPNSIQFLTGIFDYRRYFRLWSDYSIAFRFTAGGSTGENRQRFMLGGVDAWINWAIKNDYIPIENTADFFFFEAISGPIVPLRGYVYNEQSGSKFALMNLEFRFPLIRYFIGGALPLAFRNLMGVIFLDMGSAWDSWRSWRAFHQPDPFTGTLTKDLLIGTGYGFRIYLFGLLLRLDIAWRFNWGSFSKPVYYFSFGPDY